MERLKSRIKKRSDVDLINLINEHILCIKGIKNPKLNYVVTVGYSEGNTGKNDKAKLLDITRRVFAGKAKWFGKDSDWDQDATQHYIAI